ncbi:GPP34 family phosphoprotein [Saccharopolyspora spinosporotrichia]
MAELGELALRGRLLVRFEESALPGLRFFRFEHAVIELLAAERTGLWWADHLLAELLQRREAGPIPLDYKWVRRHHDALPRHRAALAHRGLLRVEPATGLTRFIARERHRPDTAVRDALIAELRAPTAGRRALDARLLFLSDLVAAVGLHGELGISDRAFPGG